MPLIKTIAPEDATGELARLYKVVEKMRGTIDNRAKFFSTSPQLLRQQIDWLGYYMSHPTLSMPLLAAIRFLVSSGETCQMCIGQNTALLINHAGWSQEQVEAMRENIDDANLPKREIAMLHLVMKAIKNAHAVNAHDLDTLREMDWSDSDIFDAVNHAARMLATDIVFNAFKIENF